MTIHWYLPLFQLTVFFFFLFTFQANLTQIPTNSFLLWNFISSHYRQFYYDGRCRKAYTKVCSLSLSHMHTHMHTHAMHTRSLTQAYSESHAYNVMSQVLRLQRHLGHTPWRILSHQDIVTGVFPIKHWKGWFWCQLLTTKNGIVAAYTLYTTVHCFCFCLKWLGAW